MQIRAEEQDEEDKKAIALMGTKGHDRADVRTASTDGMADVDVMAMAMQNESLF